MKKLEDILATIEKERGGVATIHSAFEAFPPGVEAHYQFYQQIFLGEHLPLSRLEREWLAVKVSIANECPYCMGHHQEALRLQQEKIGLEMEELRRDALSELALKLTTEPFKAHILKEKFLNAGFQEAHWQHAVFVISYFNFANRLAHSMQLDLEPEFENTCS